MADISKGKSPFYPGQPVPVEFFTGRTAQIERIITRGVSQVANGKPVAMFIQGEYGIGKSSIAGFTQWIAEKDYGLHSVYAPLGGAQNIEDVGAAVLAAVVRSGVFDPNKSERLRNWLAKYIGKQELYGFTLNLEALRNDGPTLATPFGILGFFSEVRERLKESGIRGVFLVLDEINGIASESQFAHFIKGLVDTNAMSRSPLPLFLMVCGVEDRRREMIQKHQPVDRIFDIVEINPMSPQEMAEFFTKAFSSVQITIDSAAMETMIHYSAGFPKIMHLVGDAAYWTDKDGTIDRMDALSAVLNAAEEVGKKYVDQQVYKELRSDDYRSILAKIAKMGPDVMTFTKTQVASDLTTSEARKFNNFLQRMKRLNVIRSGNTKGEYLFNLRMVRLYIWLDSIRKEMKTSIA